MSSIAVPTRRQRPAHRARRSSVRRAAAGSAFLAAATLALSLATSHSPASAHGVVPADRAGVSAR